MSDETLLLATAKTLCALAEFFDDDEPTRRAIHKYDHHNFDIEIASLPKESAKRLHR
jgi:hypothetical protein